jgi:hypothetical protein
LHLSRAKTDTELYNIYIYILYYGGPEHIHARSIDERSIDEQSESRPEHSVFEEQAALRTALEERTNLTKRADSAEDSPVFGCYCQKLGQVRLELSIWSLEVTLELESGEAGSWSGDSARSRSKSDELLCSAIEMLQSSKIHQWILQNPFLNGY